MNFDLAFERLIGHEGGYVDHPEDPGKATKFGISSKSHPGEDIPGMTLERAKAIYRLKYWGPACCDALPDELKFPMFDLAVNSGVQAATVMLQEVVGVTPDGVIGPRTLQAINSMPALRLVAHFYGERLEFMANLKTWPVFGRGWARRIATNLKEV